MTGAVRIALVAAAVMLGVPAQASAAQIVVGFTPAATPAERSNALARLPVQRTGEIPTLRALSLEVADHAAASVRRALERRPGVRYVATDVRMRAAWTPDDPRHGHQWGLAKIGSGVAWDTTRSSSGITVAIVDTGVDYNHPDLHAKVIKGADFVAGDGDPYDEHGHGTHVAGIAAASTNNATGIAGTAPDASILAVRVLDASGSGYMSWVANGIVHAADQGAHVINLSLGGSSGTTTLRDAVVYARGKGAVITCASGNDGKSSLSYPAAYAECLSVGATDSSDVRASFSNYGTGLDVMAPGVSILSTVRGDGYSSWSGTSMATPFVSGVAALLASQGLAGTAVEDAITSTATDLGAAGYDTVYGYGRLNASAAVAVAAPPTTDDGGSTEQPAPTESEPAPTEPAPTEPAPTNSAPVCSSSSVTASGATTIILSCTDAEGDPLTLAMGTAPSKGTLSAIDQTTGTVVYTPATKAKGKDSFTFRATDGSLSSSDATVSISLKSTATAKTKTVCRTVRGTRTCARYVISSPTARTKTICRKVGGQRLCTRFRAYRALPAHGPRKAEPRRYSLVWLPVADRRR